MLLTESSSISMVFPFLPLSGHCPVSSLLGPILLLRVGLCKHIGHLSKVSFLFLLLSSLILGGTILSHVQI